MKEVVKYSHCFICGDKNIHGVKAKFYFDGHQVSTQIIASEDFEGYRGIFHGGIISSLLDEVMIKAILVQGKYAVTVELNIKFMKPVKTGDIVRFIGKVTNNKKRLFWAEGKAVGDKGQVYATATAKYMEATDELKEQLMNSID
ncbi:MAG: PaaI family thioesterase [FCB group bacterium]|nr:PaaI family thioesterase [FCB group bacterium]